MMANHCIEVVCSGCGECWCDRGCGFGSPPNKKTAEKARRRHEMLLEAGKHSHVWDMHCCEHPDGGFWPVLSISILHGDDPVPKTAWERL